MAISYQAKIDLIVGGLEKIEAAEKRIKSLLRESRKLQRGGIAQRGTAALAATTREGRQQSRRQVRNAERRLELQSKLNSATDLYNRKLQQFQRAGGAGNKQLQGRVDQITQAFAVGTKEGTKNLRLTRALATELGRVVEQQRELNRARAQGNKGFEAGRRGFERIEALRASGFGSERQISGAESLVRKIGPAAASGDQAAFNEAVRKAEVALRRLEREFQLAERAQRASTKAKRDVERAERKLANEAKKDARDRANRRKRRFQDIATGAGFPLLFGGGPVQALAGGIGGALGGFGGSIAATAIVSQVQAFLQEVGKVGQALGSVSGSFDLMSEKALFTSDETQLLVQAMIEQGDAAGAARKMTEELARKIGQSGIKKLKEFGDETKKLGGLVNTLILRFQAFIANALTPLLKFLNSALEATDTRQRFAQLRSELTGDRKAAFEARLKQLGVRDTSRGTKGLEGKGGLEKMRTLLEEFPLESIQVAGGQITPSAADLAAANKIVSKPKKKTQAERDEEALQRLLLRGEQERERLMARQVEIKGNLIQSLGDELDLVKAQGNGTEEQVRQQQRIDELVRKTNDEGMRPMIESYVKQIDKQKQLNAAAAEMDKIYEGIGMSIKDGVVNSIQAAVDGTKSLAEVASNTLKNIANQLLNIGVNFGLFGVPFGTGSGGGLLGGFFANGGRPPVGKPSVVGERGPELFVPRSSGTIVPNNAMGGSTNVVVNVDAKGTAAQGDDAQAGQLGRLIGAAVQAELIKQKRPGGLLTR